MTSGDSVSLSKLEWLLLLVPVSKTELIVELGVLYKLIGFVLGSPLPQNAKGPHIHLIACSITVLLIRARKLYLLIHSD